MGSQSTNEPFQENLEDSSRDERVKNTDSCIVDIPEAADADLAEEEYDKRHEESDQGCSPDGDLRCVSEQPPRRIRLMANLQSHYA